MIDSSERTQLKKKLIQAKKKYKSKIRNLKETRKLKSYKPYKIYKETEDYTKQKNKEDYTRKAKEIAKILKIPDTNYIEFILYNQEPSTITISEFIGNATSGKYRGLTTQERSQGGSQESVNQYLPSMLEAINANRQKSKTSELRDLIPMLNEIKGGPSQPMFKDMISDYSNPGTTMYRRQNDLAEYMDKYAQLTNDLDVSRIKFKEKLEMLKDSWGDSLKIGHEERERQFEPFLRDTIPLMEVQSKKFNPDSMYHYPQVEPKFKKYRL